MLIDTHCHLDFPAFDGWRAEALAAAARADVRRIVVPGVTRAEWSRLLQLVEQQPDPRVRLYPALGLHPCFMAEYGDGDIDALAQLLERRRDLVAIGEIGLDFFIEPHDAAAQIALLRQQLQLAKRFELPVLLHVRKAHDRVLQLLRQVKLARGGIVHAFSGSEQQARVYAGLGFKLGFGGAISYARARKLRRLVAELPLEWLVLETDAPDMVLEAWRDEPNRPQRVADVAQLIAQLRGEPPERVAAVTTASASALLRLDRG